MIIGSYRESFFKKKVSNIDYPKADNVNDGGALKNKGKQMTMKSVTEKPVHKTADEGAIEVSSPEECQEIADKRLRQQGCFKSEGAWGGLASDWECPPGAEEGPVVCFIKGEGKNPFENFATGRQIYRDVSSDEDLSNEGCKKRMDKETGIPYWRCTEKRKAVSVTDMKVPENTEPMIPESEMEEIFPPTEDEYY